MLIRELGEDYEPLRALCERALPLDQWTVPLLRHRLLHEPDHRPAYQLLAWDGDRLVGAILGSVRRDSSGPFGGIRLLAVDPAQRRQGIASELLAELRARMQAETLARLRVGGIAPVYFQAGMDVRYTPGYCFLEAHGFERTGEAINMLVDLAARDWDTAAYEAALAPAGFAFRRLAPEDRPAFDAWLTEHWSGPFHHEALNGYWNDPVSTFIATHGGQICAFASYNVGGMENAFGPTGTQDGFKNRGLGRVLFFHCMQDMKDLGHPTSEIGWVGPITFYAKVCAAWIHRVFWFYERQI